MNAMAVIREHRGLLSKIARELGVNRSTVSQWPQVPPKRVVAVETITGISRHLLRPDLYLPGGRSVRTHAAKRREA
jgi:DNA-binding transcriptional regulator YdaS (Cro superfamily)